MFTTIIFIAVSLLQFQVSSSGRTGHTFTSNDAGGGSSRSGASIAKCGPTSNCGSAFGGMPFQQQIVKPTRSLGGSCKKSAECRTAFAECRQNVCRCRAGFQPDAQSRCGAINVACPIGAPMKQRNGQPVGCTIEHTYGGGGPLMAGRKRRQVDSMVLDHVKDSCPNNYFCMSHNNQMYSEKQEGHCCPKPKNACPVGQPDTRYSCDNLGLPMPANGKTECPYETHYCTSFGQAWSPALAATAICCPSPCPQMTVLKNGVCYGAVKLGESCQVDDECFENQGKCINGKCACGRGKLASSDNTYCTTPRCYSPSGGPNSMQFKPALKSPNGAFRKCRKDAQCGANNYCAEETFCCPEQKPYCPDNPSKSQTTARKCSVMPIDIDIHGPGPRPGDIALDLDSECPSGQFCHVYSMGTEPKGICCKEMEFEYDDFGGGQPVNQGRAGRTG